MTSISDSGLWIDLPSSIRRCERFALALLSRPSGASQGPSIPQDDRAAQDDALSFVRRESQVDAGVRIVPAARDHFTARVEAKAVFAVDVQVAEERCFPSAETVVADRDRNRHVDADHADFDFALETAGRRAA